MTITPSTRWIIYSFFSKLPISAVAAIIPLIATGFIFGLMNTFGRIMTYQDSFVLLAVYLVSFVLIYGYSLVRAHSYIRRSKIVSTNDGVEIFQSFIEKNQVLIPFVKITSIEVDQTLFERPLDLSTLFIYTNSSDDNFELSGLLFDDAKRFAEKVTSEHKLKVK